MATHKAGPPPLRPYQWEVARAIIGSVESGLGHTITVEIARQGGKNEVASQVEACLLTRNEDIGGEIVKCAPTRVPQLAISIRRLRARLRDADLSARLRTDGGSITLGSARIHFLSAELHSNVVGHTASLLLAADEAQDIDVDKFDRDFRPMAAAHNATTVLYGTSWDDRTLLERTRQASVEAERRDGIRRVFRYPWQVVADHVPGYAAYVEGERARLGERHPLFLTQYCLEPVSGGGRLLSPNELRAMRGDHARLAAPVAGETYVAGLDIAGGGDDTRSGRDSTVLTIGRVVFPDRGAPLDEARIEVAEHAVWTGVPHEHLLAQLIDGLRTVWRVERIAIDATGLGETIARLVARALGDARVDAIKFTAEAKSRLGFALLAAAQGGRLKCYAGDGSPQYAEFWRQAEHARAVYRANQTLNFFVDPADGHDDYVVSAALLVHAARSRTRRAAIGRQRTAP